MSDFATFAAECGYEVWSSAPGKDVEPDVWAEWYRVERDKGGSE
jgi:hypothetical protein